MNALDLAEDLRTGRISATELIGESLDRLDRLTPVIGAVAAVDPERSLAEAKAADRRLRAGAGRALEGVPFTVKDWIDVAGWPVSGATGTDRGCPDRRPARDATAVARMRAAGAVVLGISRAMADSAEHGPTRNPRDPSRAPGRFLLGCRRPGRLGCVPAGAGQ